jgi:hypothetical protein
MMAMRRRIQVRIATLPQSEFVHFRHGFLEKPNWIQTGEILESGSLFVVTSLKRDIVGRYRVGMCLETGRPERMLSFAGTRIPSRRNTIARKGTLWRVRIRCKSSLGDRNGWSGPIRREVGGGRRDNLRRKKRGCEISCLK